MKTRHIFVSITNREHATWWNNKARKLIKVVNYDRIIETATTKEVGVIFEIKGLLADYVVKKNLGFLKKPVSLKVTKTI